MRRAIHIGSTSAQTMEKRKSRPEATEEQPPYSRLFIVCSKQHDEEIFRDAFSRFGTIEDVRMPRDRNTDEPKGVAYIKFSKTSEAAKALEEMNFKKIKDGTRQIKVMVAASKSEVTDDDDDKYRRLFLTVSKSATEDDIRNDFEKFGTIESVLIQKDKGSGERKGFAYVKFRKFSSAALAYEEVDRKYRPIFARPKKLLHRETSFESNINAVVHQSSNAVGGVGGMIPGHGEGYVRLQVMCSPYLTQDLIGRLFDIVPGMESCNYWTDLISDCGKAIVVYQNPAAASYARQKLHNFEYPPGQRIFVKPDNSHKSNFPSRESCNEMAGLVQNLKNAMSSNATPDLVQLVETIAQASTLIKKATSGRGGPDGELSYCSQPLPPLQPLADVNAQSAKRCFIVCVGQPPASTILRDVFCRFGDLIDVYTLPNKTVGYARYASVQAADEAIRVLHGAEICGVRVKVMEAEERGSRDDGDHATKRARMEH